MTSLLIIAYVARYFLVGSLITWLTRNDDDIEVGCNEHLEVSNTWLTN
jgi:hypothetical protein